MEEQDEEKGKQSPIKLESDVRNSIRHSFLLLDETSSGKVNKSKLQVLCASLCRDVGLTFNTQHLVDFNSPSTSITFQDFIQYLQNELLSQGTLNIFKLYLSLTIYLAFLNAMVSPKIGLTSYVQGL